MIMDYHGENLESFLSRTDVNFTEDNAVYTLYNLLCGINYLHSSNVLHRNLQPKSIQINDHCQVKFCDFSSAKAFQENYKELQIQVDLTYSLTTQKCYMAPELQAHSIYDPNIDIWIAGCIFAELINFSKKKPKKPYLKEIMRLKIKNCVIKTQITS